MVYSPKEAVEILGVCTVTVLRMIRRGEIPACKIGSRTIRIEEKDLEAFKAKCKTGNRLA